jgi:2-oxoisovalerate dehydrogenase E1 component
MAVQTRVKVAKSEAPKNEKYGGLSRDTLIRLYRTMYLSRKLDDREIQLKRQNKIYFQIPARAMKRSPRLWGYFYGPVWTGCIRTTRDRALCLMLGVTPLEMLLQAVGAKDDPSSGGRQMPSHFGHPKFNIPSKSSCTGTQFVHAVGAAEATLYYEQHPKALAQAKKAPLGELAKHTTDEIVYVSSGDGATSEGEFWESLNVTCIKKLPLLYLVEDNGYAISVPVEVQTAGGSIAKLVKGFPDFMCRSGWNGPCGKLPGVPGSGELLPRAARASTDPCESDAAVFAFAER